MSAEHFKHHTWIDVWTNDTSVALEFLHSAYGLGPVADEEVVRFGPFGTDVAAIKLEDNSTLLQVTGPTRTATALDRSRIDYPLVIESAAETPLRPVIQHATIIHTTDIEALVERMRRLGLRHRFDEPSAMIPKPRLWIGYGSDKADPWYRPSVDGGLKLEFGQYADGAAGVGPSAVASSVDISGLEASMFLVDDVHARVVTLERNFGWEPIDVTTRGDALVARFGFSDGDSAYVELISPKDADTLVGRHLGDWGVGPYFRRMTCSDLDGRAESLHAHGVEVTRGTSLDGSGRRAIFVQGGLEFSSAFELVEPPV
jgi:hypothetical protein